MRSDLECEVGPFTINANNHASFDAWSVVTNERLLHFFFTDFNSLSGQFPQGQHRPDDLLGVLLGRHAALVADQLDPLVAREIESLRHGIDLGIDLLGADDDPLALATLLDDRLVDDQRLLDLLEVEDRFAALLAAVDELQRLLKDHVRDELREESRTALLRLEDVVELRPDPVERPEERVVHVVAHAIGVDHAVKELLGAGVDPAGLVDGAVDKG